MFPLRDNLRCSIFPIATIIFIALNCAAFIYELMIQASGTPTQVEHFFSTYTMVPHKLTLAFATGDPHLIGLAVMSIFTAMFLHGGWMHLIGNMIYLYCFGRGMEGRLGRTNFILFYLLCGVAAATAQWANDPSSVVPTLGASGAIAGVLGGYIYLWPKAKIKGVLLIGFLPLIFTVSAFWYLLFWITMQISDVITAIGKVAENTGGVAYWEHIGGFFLGLLIAIAWKRFRPDSDVCFIPQNCPCPDPKKEEKSTNIDDLGGH